MNKITNIVPEDLFKIGCIDNARITKDGGKAIYSLRRTNIEKDIDLKAIWEVEISSGISTLLTNPNYSCGDLVYNTDESKIAYVSARGEASQIYEMDLATKEERKITNFKNGVTTAGEYSPDGKYLAFCAFTDDFKPIDETKPYRITRALYKSNGMGFVPDKLADLFILDLNTGEIKNMTNDTCNISDPKWSTDSKSLLYKSSFAADSLTPLPDLIYMDLEGNTKKLLESWRYVGALALLKDGKHILFSGYPSHMKLGTQRKIWLMNIETGEYECRSTGADVDFSWGIQSDLPIALGNRFGISEDEKFAYVQVGVGTAVEIYKLSIWGEIDCKPIISSEASYMLAGMSRNKKILYTYSDLNIPSELGIFDEITGENKLITHVNDDFVNSHPKLSLEEITHESVDGKIVRSFLLIPPTGNAPYPTITYYHGGPMAGLGHMYYFEMHMFAGAGYAVFMPNFRGSSGFGDEFAQDIYSEKIGKAAKLGLADTLYGLDYAIKKGLVDGDRMGCCGISHGGFLTCWSIGNTDRFKAAVSENPITNQMSFLGTSDYPWYIINEMGGVFPHENLDLYLNESPIMYAQNAKTPILLVQSDQDYRCPAEQTEQFYGYLRVMGCYAEMLRLPNSAHGSSNHGPNIIRRAQNEAQLEWMQRYIKV